jgi:hypothetical protein
MIEVEKRFLYTPPSIIDVICSFLKDQPTYENVLIAAVTSWQVLDDNTKPLSTYIYEDWMKARDSDELTIFCFQILIYISSLFDMDLLSFIDNLEDLITTMLRSNPEEMIKSPIFPDTLKQLSVQAKRGQVRLMLNSA